MNHKNDFQNGREMTKSGRYVAVGISLGVAIGMVFGILANNILLGLISGLTIGLIGGVSLGSVLKNNRGDAIIGSNKYC